MSDPDVQEPFYLNFGWRRSGIPNEPVGSPATTNSIDFKSLTTGEQNTNSVGVSIRQWTLRL